MTSRPPPPGRPTGGNVPFDTTRPLPVGSPIAPDRPTGPLPPTRRPMPRLLLAVAVIAACVILVALAVALRSRDPAPVATPIVAATRVPTAAAPPTPAASTAAIPVVDVANGALFAAPNPVAAGSGQGTTVVSWVTPDGAVGQVWVSTDGQTEVLFAQGASGAQYASFIEAGKRYEFRLYRGTAHTGTPVKRVVVTRER